MDKLYQGIKASVTSEDVVARLRREGGDVNPMPPAEFSKFIKAEVEKYRKIIEVSGATAN